MNGIRGAFFEFIGDIRGRAIWVILGCLACQMGLGFGYVFSALAAEIIAEFEWTRVMYESARAPQIFIIALASPLVGTLAVRFGARSVLVGGTVALGVGFLLVSLMQALWQMYGLVMLLGLAVVALGDISVGQIVTRWIDRGRGLALGIVYTGSNLGGWLLVPIAVKIAANESWRASFAWIGGGALLLMLPIAIFVVREPKRMPASLAAAHRTNSGAPESDLDLAAALRTRSFWILAVALFTFFFYFLGVLNCLVLFLTDSGMPKAEATLYFSTSLGLGIVSKVVLGAISDRIPHRVAMLIDYALLAISSIVLLSLPDLAPMWLFVGTFAFATAARDVVYPLIIADCFGVRYLAQIYGALMLALLPGGILGPIFAAAIHDRFGNYRDAFATFAVLNALAFIGLIFVRPEQNHDGVSRTVR